VLDELFYPLVMRVSQGVECGSHAAAPAVPTIWRVARRYPSWHGDTGCTCDDPGRTCRMAKRSRTLWSV
jgi:hypothetical protein